MKISIKSWHTQLYFIMYGGYNFYSWEDTEIERCKLPESLCPYFWKVVFAIVYLSLLFWIHIPYVSIRTITEGKSFLKSIKKDGLFNEKDGTLAFFTFILCVIIVCMFVMFFTNNGGVEIFGIIGWFILFVVLMVGIIDFIGEQIKKRKKNRPYVEKKPNILIEYIKAKKEKVCPRITWL